MASSKSKLKTAGIGVSPLLFVDEPETPATATDELALADTVLDFLETVGAFGAEVLILRFLFASVAAATCGGVSLAALALADRRVEERVPEDILEGIRLTVLRRYRCNRKPGFLINMQLVG